MTRGWRCGLLAVVAVGATIGLRSPVFAGASIGNWFDAGSLSIARADQTATLLVNGKVLIAGGTTGGVSAGAGLADAESYDPSDNSWSAVAPMLSPHAFATATLLNDGRVLVANGIGADGHTTADTELYDPQRNSWVSAGAITRRYQAAALPLADGRVIVMGGLNLSGLVNDTEIFDPVSNRWSAAAPMNVSREGHVAVRLRDGRVLVAGGMHDLRSGPVSSGEIYDPAINRWSVAAPMSVPRVYFAGALLQDGRVLVVGGGGPPGAEIYDPQHDSWTPTGAMNASHNEETLSVLPNGQVVSLGGGGDSTNQVPNPDVEIYDPPTDTWIAAAQMPEPRWGHTATVLSTGDVLVVGGTVPYSGDAAPLSAAALFDYGVVHAGGSGSATALSSGTAVTTAVTAGGDVIVPSAIPEIHTAAHRATVVNRSGGPTPLVIMAAIAALVGTLALLSVIGLRLRMFLRRRRGI